MPDLCELEIDVIRTFSSLLGLSEGEVKGYITSGGTEGNFACLWWTKRYLTIKSKDELNKLRKIVNDTKSSELDVLRAEKKRPCV